MYSLFPIHVSFPFTPLQRVEAFSLICLRQAGSMDTCRVVLNLRPQDANPYITAGSPMQIRWVGDGVEDTFTGYVHSYKQANDNYLERTVIMGISAAYPMYNESGRSFYQVGIHNVAEEIADDYGFQAEVDPHKLQQAQILQQDESDWAFLKRLASEWGYVLVLDGVTLIFRPQERILKENSRAASRDITNSSLTTGRGSTLKAFVPNFSAAGTSPYAVATGQGVQPVTTARIEWESSGEGAFQQIDTGASVTTELEGEMAAIGREAKLRFPFTAKAVVMYPAGKKPLDAYQIEHQGVEITWTIHAIKHIVTGSQYIADMILGSDGTDYATGTDSRIIDISLLLAGNRRAFRPDPQIIRSQPYYIGTGANTVMEDERWKARLMRTQIRSREEVQTWQ